MNKKGFTLVELLGVIVVMGIIIGIAVPSVSRMLNDSKAKMFCEKVKSIESAGKFYGQDNYSLKASSSEAILEEKVAMSILVNKGYLKKDEDTCKMSNNSSCLKDPRDGSSMDNTFVQIYTKNKKIYARYLYSEKDKNEKVCGDDINYYTN